MEKSKSFSDKDIIYSDDKVEIYVWNKNLKKKCKDCGEPIWRSSIRCTKCNGRLYGGRNKKLNEEEFLKMYSKPQITNRDIAKKFNVSIGTVSRWRKELGLTDRRKRKR